MLHSFAKTLPVLDTTSTANATAAVDVLGAKTVGIHQVPVSGTAMVCTAEESNDGVTWFSAGTTNTGNQITSYTPKGRWMRMRCTTIEAATSVNHHIHVVRQ